MNSTDSQNELGGAPLSRVPRLTDDQFQQCLAVAQLAVKLCELETAKRQTSLQKENLNPATFLGRAWKLIESAREHALRPQTDTEYLVEHGGSGEAVQKVVGRILQKSYVPFQKLCDHKRNKGDTETIHEVEWTVYRSERGFDDLFCDYWRAITPTRDGSKEWNGLDQANPWELAKFWYVWEEVLLNGEPLRKQTLKSWKKNGIPPNTFLALATFRRKRDNRAENLKNGRQGKRNRRESRKERIRKS